MKATSLISAPNASDISTIALAPPGDDPQIAVLAGSTRSRASSQPSAVLTMITATTAPIKTAQSAIMSRTIEPVMVCVIMQPTIAWPQVKSSEGMRMPVCSTAQMIAATIGPSSSEAGRCICANSSSTATERIRSAAA